MGVYKKEEIAAVWVGEELVCQDCMESEEWAEMKEEGIITTHDIESDEETIRFCDRCKTKI